MTATWQRAWRTILVATLALGACIITGCNNAPQHRERATEALSVGDLGAAEQHLIKAEEAHPSSWKTQIMLGKLRLQLNQPLEAQIALERAWTMRPRHEQTPEILDLLAEAYFQQGEKAHDLLIEFLASTAARYGTPRDYFRQARYLMGLRDPDSAAIALRTGVQISDPNDPETYLLQADFYEAVNDEANTILNLRKAYYLAPEDPDIRARLRKYYIVPGPTIGIPPTQSR